MLRDFKKPDLNAPRYRKKYLNILNQEFYKNIKKEHPHLAQYTNQQLKSIVTTFNGLIWQNVIDVRDGVELPEQLGILFIGTCKRKIKDNPDYFKSEHYGKRVQHQNWESDQYLQKIFYTNFGSKYPFKFHQLWGFEPVRDFKRAAAHNYPHQWKKYVVVDNMTKVSKIFRKNTYKHYIVAKERRDIENSNYDEFDMS
jgi:hypothetical protein